MHSYWECSIKKAILKIFYNIPRKTPVLESLFDKVVPTQMLERLYRRASANGCFLISSSTAMKSSICLLNCIKLGKYVFYIYSYLFGIIIFVFHPEAVIRRCSLKAVFKNFAKLTGKHLCWRLFLSTASNLIKI